MGKRGGDVVRVEAVHDDGAGVAGSVAKCPEVRGEIDLTVARRDDAMVVVEILGVGKGDAALETVAGVLQNCRLLGERRVIGAYGWFRLHR